MLLLQCFLLNITAYILRHKWVGEKSTLCNNFIHEKGVGLFVNVGLIFGDYRIGGGGGKGVYKFKEITYCTSFVCM